MNTYEVYPQSDGGFAGQSYHTQQEEEQHLGAHYVAQYDSSILNASSIEGWGDLSSTGNLFNDAGILPQFPGVIDNDLSPLLIFENNAFSLSTFGTTQSPYPTVPEDILQPNFVAGSSSHYCVRPPYPPSTLMFSHGYQPQGQHFSSPGSYNPQSTASTSSTVSLPQERNAGSEGFDTSPKSSLVSPADKCDSQPTPERTDPSVYDNTHKLPELKSAMSMGTGIARPSLVAVYRSQHPPRQMGMGFPANHPSHMVPVPGSGMSMGAGFAQPSAPPTLPASISSSRIQPVVPASGKVKLTRKSNPRKPYTKAKTSMKDSTGESPFSAVCAHGCGYDKAGDKRTLERHMESCTNNPVAPGYICLGVQGPSGQVCNTLLTGRFASLTQHVNTKHVALLKSLPKETQVHYKQFLKAEIMGLKVRDKEAAVSQFLLSKAGVETQALIRNTNKHAQALFECVQAVEHN